MKKEMLHRLEVNTPGRAAGGISTIDAMHVPVQYQPQTETAKNDVSCSIGRPAVGRWPWRRFESAKVDTGELVFPCPLRRPQKHHQLTTTCSGGRVWDAIGERVSGAPR